MKNRGMIEGNDYDPTSVGIKGGKIDNTTIGGTTPAAGAFTQVKWAKGADVASATALALGADGNYFDITGTVAITSIGTLAIGTMVCLHFDGILTLTHHATDLILPGAANITTAAGDEAILIEYATGGWRCINYSTAAKSGDVTAAAEIAANTVVVGDDGAKGVKASTVLIAGAGGTLTVTQDTSLDEAVAMSSKAPKENPSITGIFTQDTYVVRKFITKSSITDNSATSVFRITTVDEASQDGGAYSVKVHALVGQGILAGSASIAVKSFTAQFVHVIDDSGNISNSAVSEVCETASAADAPAVRDIGTVTMTVLATSAYLTDVQFLIDTTGTASTTAQVFIIVELVWAGFLTPPTITSL